MRSSSLNDTSLLVKCKPTLGFGSQRLNVINGLGDVIIFIIITICFAQDCTDLFVASSIATAQSAGPVLRDQGEVRTNQESNADVCIPI